jgi:outer membrane protein assembly factor BamB
MRLLTLSALTLIANMAIIGMASAEESARDWPQWRGPNRDGVATASPKLLDSWPKEGPKLLWKSDPIPSTFGEGGRLADGGGSSSPIVYDGKVFVFVHWKRQIGKLIITTQMLKDLGWEEDVSDDLAQKIEEARLDKKRMDLTGSALEAYINEFMATIDPQMVEKFRAHIKQRLTQGPIALSWKQDLAHLVKARDIEFKTYDELNNAVDHCFKPGTHGAPGTDNIFPCFLDPFMSKVFSFMDTIVCLDGATGKEVWKKEFPGDIPERELHWGASATPAIWNDRIYAAGSAGLYCLSVKDGSVVWQVKADLGNSSPLVVDGRLYIYEGGVIKESRFKWRAAKSLTAFNADTGEVLWRQPQVGYTNGSVAMWANAGKKYLISGAPGGPWCVDPDTGKVLWGCPTGAPSVPNIWTCDATPAISGDVLVLYAEPKMAFRLTPAKAEFLWKAPGGTRGASALIYQDHAYFFGGQGDAICLDLNTGKPKWSKHGITGESSSPVLADGKVFYAPCRYGDSSTVGMFRASPENFECLGNTVAAPNSPVPSGAASPAIADGKLYLRMNDCVACYDVREYGPYLSKTIVTREKVEFVLKQADGLSAKDSPDGSIKGLTLKDALVESQAIKARIDGTSLIVDINAAAFPLTIAYSGNGNLSAKGIASAPFEWRTPRLQFQKCIENKIALKLDRSVEQELWKSAKSYSVSGAKVTGVEVMKADNSVLLTTDRTWKIGDQAVVQYPATRELPGILANVPFTVLPGRLVEEGPLQEFLVGALQESIDLGKVFDQDSLDKMTKPVAGEKWKLCKESSGVFDLTTLVGGQNNILAHACVYLYSDSARKTQFWVGSDDGIQIVVNGKAVHSNPAARPFDQDQDKIKDVVLSKGWNTVLLGISQGGGGWAFSLRIRNDTGDAAPTGLTYSAELPEEK